MSCRHCGKPVGLLRRLKGSAYCSDAHQNAEEFNPATLVLQTLFRPDQTPTPAPAGPKPEAAPARLEDHSDVLEALLTALGDTTSPAETETQTPEPEPKDPPEAGFLMELPEPQPSSSRRNQYAPISPSHTSLAPSEPRFTLATGPIQGPSRIDDRWLWAMIEGETEPAPAISPAVEVPEDIAPPLAGFVQVFSPALGSCTCKSQVESIRHRSGPRPRFRALFTPYQLVAEFHIPRPVSPPRAPEPEPQPEIPQPSTDLQDSLVRMLVDLSDEY